MSKVSRIPLTRPSLSGGAKSLRAYRRTADFGIEMVLAGMISAREGKALVEMAKMGAELFMAEKQLVLHHVDQEPDDHPLGHDGGAEQIPLDVMVAQRPSDAVGYETLVPEPESEQTRLAAASGLSKQHVGHQPSDISRSGEEAGEFPKSGLNGYKGKKGGNFPPPRPVDINRKIDDEDDIKI